MPIIGKCCLQVNYKNKTEKFLFHVVDMDSCPLLGLKACTELDIIKRVDNLELNHNNQIQLLLEKYKDLFSGIGCLEKPYCIELKENARPVISYPRKIPFAVQEMFKMTRKSD